MGRRFASFEAGSPRPPGFNSSPLRGGRDAAENPSRDGTTPTSRRYARARPRWPAIRAPAWCPASLVITLLNGGCGHEDLRCFTPVPLLGRLRPAVRPAATRPSGSRPRRPGRPTTSRRSADDQYRITMAVAGFTPDEIELIQHDTTLLVVGPEDGPGGRAAVPAPRHRGSRRSARPSTSPTTSRSLGASLGERAAHRRPQARGARGPEAAPHRHRRRHGHRPDRTTRRPGSPEAEPAEAQDSPERQGRTRQAPSARGRGQPEAA